MIIVHSVFWPLVGIATFSGIAVCLLFAYYCFDAYKRRHLTNERRNTVRAEDSEVEVMEMDNFTSQSSLHPILAEGGDYGSGRGRAKGADLRRAVLSSRTRQRPGNTTFTDLTWRSENDQGNESKLSRNGKDVQEEEVERNPPLYVSINGDVESGRPRTSTTLRGKESREKSDGEPDSSIYELPSDSRWEEEKEEATANVQNRNQETNRYQNLWPRIYTPNYGVNRAWPAEGGAKRTHC